MRIARLVALWALVAFLGLSVYGAFFGKPGEPFLRLTGCYKGFWPTLAFGGTTNAFAYIEDEWGPDFFRTKTRAIAWPGGVLGYFIVPKCASEIEGYDENAPVRKPGEQHARS